MIKALRVEIFGLGSLRCLRSRMNPVFNDLLCRLVLLQALRSSTPSSTKASMSVTPTSEGCLEQESTLQRTHQRAISTSTGSVVAQAARRTKTDPATCATGDLSEAFHSVLYCAKRLLCDTSLLIWTLRQMLFCRVTLGKSFLQFSAMKMAHAPPGHHSVIGRPSVNGLAYAEYVIYRGEQVNEDSCM